VPGGMIMSCTLMGKRELGTKSTHMYCNIRCHLSLATQIMLVQYVGWAAEICQFSRSLPFAPVAPPPSPMLASHRHGQRLLIQGTTLSCPAMFTIAGASTRAYGSRVPAHTSVPRGYPPLSQLAANIIFFSIAGQHR
jgi:hypothetical protein